VDFLTQRYRETTSVARLRWDRPSGNPKLAQWLHRVNIPTLLIRGDGDRLVPTATAAAWKAKIADSRRELVQGAGHLVLEEKASPRRDQALVIRSPNNFCERPSSQRALFNKPRGHSK
jgi:pimeloyl-ACP methyl ester carboxylesterase